MKTLESVQFHDQIIYGFKSFCRARNYKTAENYKIIPLMTSNKFQVMWLDGENVTVWLKWSFITDF